MATKSNPLTQALATLGVALLIVSCLLVPQHNVLADDGGGGGGGPIFCAGCLGCSYDSSAYPSGCDNQNLADCVRGASQPCTSACHCVADTGAGICVCPWYMP